jgi:AcrR family transcriptional regulator
VPRTPRRPEEIEAEKQRILGEALKIITESGYQGLTMRGLGQRLGMAAKTIYNYFQNKDETLRRDAETALTPICWRATIWGILPD